MIRKISAHYIFPGGAPPLKRGIVCVDEQGEITDLIDTGGELQEISNLEFYHGIITPGFAFGTENYATKQASIFEEMEIRQKKIPTIGLQELIDWGIDNGGKKVIGKGEKPGLNLITDIDFQEMKLTSLSKMKVISIAAATATFGGILIQTSK
jgi:hypothetical protein